MKADVSTEFERSYLDRPTCFGSLPSRGLMQFLGHKTDQSLHILDLGCGHGRNAFYVAGLGHSVVAVDSSKAAIDALNEQAICKGLPIRAVHADIRDFRLERKGYDLIVAVTVLGHLAFEETRALAGRMTDALKPRGAVFVEAFSRQDPGFVDLPQASEFASLVKHYFTGEELRYVFGTLSVEEQSTFRVTDATHGTEHDHVILRFIGEKP
ncbi:MAG: class I SAM-dependent methyltransferase [Candidatus Brocadiia bacterium]